MNYSQSKVFFDWNPKIICISTLFSLDYPETAIILGAPDFKGFILFSLRTLHQLMICGKTARLSCGVYNHPLHGKIAQPTVILFNMHLLPYLKEGKDLVLEVTTSENRSPNTQPRNWWYICKTDFCKSDIETIML